VCTVAPPAKRGARNSVARIKTGAAHAANKTRDTGFQRPFLLWDLGANRVFRPLAPIVDTTFAFRHTVTSAIR
jgi:hypothetical protein